ncbi:MAG: hypothetical protein MI923_27530 [Phycisphaerales bacterium]|nr:hypothetical protein [Phycisphaerales bacterium]
MRTPWLSTMAAVGWLGLVGCDALDVWRPPQPTAEEYARGLLVFYPGSSNLYVEGLGYYYGLKEAGIDMAIEIVPWSGFLTHQLFPENAQEEIRARAREEATRIADYIRSHPDCPVTLMTYSGGALMALETAAAMPPDAPVDRVIVLSPGLWTHFDLGPALDGTTQNVLYYWSPHERDLVEFVARNFGTADGHFMDAAASLGFSHEDPRLIEVIWTPEMAALGNNGGHLDYVLNFDFIKGVIAPWIITHRIGPEN